MTFHSILFERAQDQVSAETIQVPDCFADLNLDQIVDAITAGKQEYNLKPLFYTPLHDMDAIEYRHEIMRELESPILLEYLNSFARQLHAMREHLEQAAKLYYKYQQERWFLDAVEMYCSAVNQLVHDLSTVELHARGLSAFRDYLAEYANSDRFTTLLAETKQLLADLSAVQYCILIKDTRVEVRKYDSEEDYSVEVEETFAKFKQGATRDYRAKFSDWMDMNHVEAQVLDCVAQLYPGLFQRLDNFCANHSDFLEPTIGVFDRQIQFYVAYLEYAARLKRAGLTFCYPRISDADKQICVDEGFDLALAGKLILEKDEAVVCNDFYLKDPERILVVSGPNQGGKSTFARMFGQLHYLANLGCPVPGREAQLFLFDQLLTHFEKQEHIQNLRGKLEDDLFRIHEILDRATPNSIVILNEIFNSTTLQDAVFLSKEILQRIVELDLLCVCVTFIDELTRLSEKTVSMVSTVVPDNPTVRTFKIVRKPADGLAYALSIAEKYRLTYDRVKERIRA